MKRNSLPFWVWLILFAPPLFRPWTPSTLAGAGPSTEQPPLYLQPKRLKGEIYQIGSDKKNLLFTFQRTASQTNSTTEVLREYRLANGAVAAREHVTYLDNKLVSYEVEQFQAGLKTRLTLEPDRKGLGGQRLIFREQAGAGLMKKFSEPAQPDVLINDMVVPFLLAHWRELIRGVTVPARFAAVSRLETVAVKFVKEAEGTHAGRPVMIIRLELANRLLTPFLKPVRFTIEKEGRHRIWEYSGRTTPRVLKSGKWVELDALTVFDWD